MAETRLDHLQILIAKALTDKIFREALLTDPRGTARDKFRMNLSSAEVSVLNSLKEDINRFGDHSDLPATDAEMWAVGAIVKSVAQGKQNDWKVRVTSIPRFHVPPKHKSVIQFIAEATRQSRKKAPTIKTKSRAKKTRVRK